VFGVPLWLKEKGSVVPKIRDEIKEVNLKSALRRLALAEAELFAASEVMAAMRVGAVLRGLK
jgi:hypothetical protein